MDNEGIFNLLDFASLIQLAAGFYIVFIAIEYKQSFAALLSERLLNFKQQIISRYQSFEIKEYELDDFSKREHYQNGQGKKALEQTKAKQENLSVLISDKITVLSSYIDKICRCDVFRYLSIYMFIYCLVILFVSGLMRVHFMVMVKYVAFYTLLSYAIMGLSAILGCFVHVIDKHSILWLVITFAVSLIALIVPMTCVEYIHLECVNESSKLFIKNGVVIAATLLPYLTFLLFIILFAKSSFAIKKKCKNEEMEVVNIYEEIRNEIDIMNGQVKQEEREKALAEE